VKISAMAAAKACVLLVSAVILCFSSSIAAAGPVGAPYKVGVAVRRFVPPEPYDWRGAKIRALLATVWYPAARVAREEQQWIGPPGAPLARAGRAARGASLAATPNRFPLVVISHGTGGSALAMAWLGTQLAAHGLIAVAVNHPGNNALEPYTAQGFTLWWLRARDLSAVIDGMLADPQFAPRIDAHRIGAAGFSLGGYTVIEIAGGRSSTVLFDSCERDAHSRSCVAPPEFPSLIDRVLTLLKTDPAYRAAVRGAGSSYRDPRVRAVFAIAPALGMVLVPDSLARISIPLEIVAGSADAIEPVGVNARYFAAHIPGSRLILFPGAGHYTFFASCTADGKKAEPELCVDHAGIDRDRLHARAAALASAFFSRYLN
jgi:predicted dienelactone hydrolase